MTHDKFDSGGAGKDTRTSDFKPRNRSTDNLLAIELEFQLADFRLQLLDGKSSFKNHHKSLDRRLSQLAIIESMIYDKFRPHESIDLLFCLLG